MIRRGQSSDASHQTLVNARAANKNGRESGIARRRTSRRSGGFLSSDDDGGNRANIAASGASSLKPRIARRRAEEE